MKLIPTLCLGACLCGLVAVSVVHLSAVEADLTPIGTFYVAPDGSDAAAGNRMAPLATLEGARLAVRRLKQKQGGQFKQPVSVIVRGGTYFLPSPLVFTPEDSGTAAYPVTYSAQDGESVVISGGQRLGAWRPGGDGLWRAKLPREVKEFRRLRQGETDGVRARTPNFDPKNPIMGGWWFAGSGFSGQPWEKGAFGQAVGNAQEVGTQLGWQVRVPATATYRVWIRYAQNMGLDMAGHTTLRSDNGIAVPLNALSDTGDWNRFQWSQAAQLPLTAGEQTLTWENVQGGGINIDALVLSDDTNWNPNDADAPERLRALATGKHRLLIQGEAATSKARNPLIPRGESVGQKDRINLAPQQLASISDDAWKEAEVNIFPGEGWVNARLKVKGVDRDRSALLVEVNDLISAGNRFYVENARGALDSPGEWYVDQEAGEVLYKPRTSDKAQSVAVVPTTDRLVVLEGNGGANKFVENVRFEGLTFADTNYTLGGYYDQADSAIWMRGAKNCAFEKCAFEHLGGYAVRMEGRSNQNSVVRCTMDGLGGGGVILLGDAKNQAFNNLIAANEISDCGKVYAHVAGIYATTSSGNKILNNRIQRMPRYGVSLKSLDGNSYSHDNIVAYNEIFDTNLETNDTGAIETLGRDKADSGNRIEYNLIRNVVGLKTTPDGEFLSPYFTWGIYLDDYSSGTTVRGNVVDGTVVGALCIHGGHDNVVENNIFLNGSEMNIRLQPRGDGEMHDNVFWRNIVAYKNPNALLWYSYAHTWKREVLGEVDNNVYWQTGGVDLAATPKAITPAGSWTQWQRLGLDERSVVANPQIVAPSEGDYRLKPNSPALKLGFEPIPLERIGPKGYND